MAILFNFFDILTHKYEQTFLCFYLNVLVYECTPGDGSTVSQAERRVIPLTLDTLHAYCPLCEKVTFVSTKLVLEPRGTIIRSSVPLMTRNQSHWGTPPECVVQLNVTVAPSCAVWLPSSGTTGRWFGSEAVTTVAYYTNIFAYNNNRTK